MVCLPVLLKQTSVSQKAIYQSLCPPKMEKKKMTTCISEFLEKRVLN